MLQFNTAYGERLTLGNAFFLAMLILSERQLVGPKAQQAPQYYGIC